MTLAPVLASPATTRPPASRGRYRTALAGPAEVDAAQRLRHRVFAEERGVSLGPGSATSLRDADEWDELCDHLVVRDEWAGEVVGTYRLLPPERALAVGRTYGDGEFDLGRHAGIRPRTVEAGRSCVHPDHRNGAVISQLWAGILRYTLGRGHTHLVGCASISLADGGATAAGVWDVARARHLAPAALRVTPHVPFDVEAPPRPARLVMPPLVRGYLRTGARVCGRPAYDRQFGTADLYLLLPLADVDPRVLRHLLGVAR